MSSNLYIAANLIPETLVFGHLQIVYRDSSGRLLENETTSPGFPYFFGDWAFPTFGRAHDDPGNTPRYGSTNDYAITVLNLRPEQTAEYVWELLGQVYASLRDSGFGLDYDVQQNSNSYVATALSVVGITIGDYLPATTPPSVSSFPGVGTNILHGAKTGGFFSGYDTKIALSLAGTQGNDFIVAGIGDDSLNGAAGNDTIRAGSGNDRLWGGEGNDRLNGGLGADRLDGGSGTDQADYSTAGSGVAADLSASATNSGEATGDTYISIEDLLGSNFADTLAGNGGANSISGGNGADLILGRGGNDWLAGGNGNDTIRGGTGNDTLVGGKGNDRVTGEAGADVFAFAIGDDTMTITDFEPGVDDLALVNLREGFTVQDLLPFVWQEGSDVVIRSGSQEVRFEDTQLSNLSGGDVIFV